MAWPLVVVLQIIASSLLAIWMRFVSVRSRKLALGIGVVSYACIATMGTLYSLMYNRGLPVLPNGQAWSFIIAEGIFIPAAWLFQFKLISHIGASNGVITGTLNSLAAALLAVIVLGETISLAFIMGGILILIGIYVSLHIKPDTSHPVSATLQAKLLLILGGMVCFALGMLFEKKAIGAIGVWNYVFYGWTMQLAGAVTLYTIFGKNELGILLKSKKMTKNAIVLGVMTSVSGLLFVIALSFGTLSHTLVAVSGKIVVTMLLAAIFLHERNNIPMRLVAFAVTTLGIALVLL